MGRYDHDFEPGGGKRKKPLPHHKRIAIAYFIFAAVAGLSLFLLPLLHMIF